MTTAHADQDSDFEAAFGAGFGLTGRLAYRTLAGNMRMRLVPGERVADVAPLASTRRSPTTRRRGAVWPPTSVSGLVAYFSAGFVLGVVLDVGWSVLIAVLVAASVLPEVWYWLRRSSRGRRKRRRSMRSLVMVTDRRLIEGVHPHEFREVTLEHVKDVQVRTGNMGIATVRSARTRAKQTSTSSASGRNDAPCQRLKRSPRTSGEAPRDDSVQLRRPP